MQKEEIGENHILRRKKVNEGKIASLKSKLARTNPTLEIEYINLLKDRIRKAELGLERINKEINKREKSGEKIFSEKFNTLVEIMCCLKPSAEEEIRQAISEHR